MDAKTAIRLSTDAFETSTTYLESSMMAHWEANERQFQSRHPVGSKYESADYKHRSKIFRPKTRSTIQSNEADCAFAFFSTANRAVIQAEDDNNQEQLASGRVHQELLNWRLRSTVPWFRIVQGAYQDCLRYDFVVAHVYWKYMQRTKRSMVEIDGFRYPQESVEVLKDTPCVELIPPENIRIDPASDWTMPIHESPYLIHVCPIPAYEAQRRMNTQDTKTGEPKWKKHKLDDLMAAGRELYDTDGLRYEREFDREDPHETKRNVKHYDLLYIHRNFIRDEEGQDWLFYTAGTSLLLTTPVKAEEAYWHLRPGERPYVMGTTAVEAHKTLPESGVVSLTKDLQREINDFTNLRLDNVKQAVLGIYGVRRTANVDYEALRLGIPGSGVLMDDPARDVLPLPKADVTTNSYQEQNRMDTDFGDISGAFAPSNVMTNRALGETVGGMEMVSAAATKVGDYRIMTFAETFMEPALDQIVRLEAAYESDLAVLSLAGQRAQLQRYGVNQITDELLRQNLTVRVDVGISSSDPTRKVQRLFTAISALGQVIGPEMLSQLLDLNQLIPEVFGAIGYTDGSRFFRNIGGEEDPRIPMLMQQIQQLQQAIETKAVEEEGRNERMQLLQDKKTAEGITKEHLKGQYQLADTAMENQAAAGMKILEMMNGSERDSS